MHRPRPAGPSRENGNLSDEGGEKKGEAPTFRPSEWKNLKNSVAEFGVRFER